jgi:hypothetical protein
MRRLIALVLIIFLVGTLGALSTIPLDAQERVTDPEWTVVLQFKKQDVPQPFVRIYVLVKARTEGEAAIKAHSHMAEKLTTQAAAALEYMEAQQKK